MEQKILEALAEIDKAQMDSTFRILEKIIENDTRKIDEMKKIAKILEQIKKTLWGVCGLIFLGFIIFSS
jgi:hypothetical protein